MGLFFSTSVAGEAVLREAERRSKSRHFHCRISYDSLIEGDVGVSATGVVNTQTRWP